MKSLKLCCKHLQFLWDNHLLERREGFDVYRPKGGPELIVGITRGFRIRRAFMFFERDRVFYRCPYCGKELIFFDEIFVPEMKFRFKAELKALSVTSKRPDFGIPMSKMKEALFTTKRRSKHWPPKD